jgi:hypothetical protein
MLERKQSLPAGYVPVAADGRSPKNLFFLTFLPGVRASAILFGLTQKLADHHSEVGREPSALEGWILEIIYCDLEAGLSCASFLRKGEVLPFVGSIQDLKDMNDPSCGKASCSPMGAFKT